MADKQKYEAFERNRNCPVPAPSVQPVQLSVQLKLAVPSARPVVSRVDEATLKTEKQEFDSRRI
jgi:hypothetical protein